MVFYLKSNSAVPLRYLLAISQNLEQLVLSLEEK
ncbi:hypothetical protein BVRB_7g175630 [Beta vulgaris subsp. vulgaris]|nr:hypothetical protein BVRB_7g175630 [Beta vulgaris subsp. vulgaris]